MKLYDCLLKFKEGSEEGLEVIVCDNVYDTETYFYVEFDNVDNWQDLMLRFSKLVEVEKTTNNCVVCKFSELIKNHIKGLKEADLFYFYNIDDVMSNFDNIMSGYVSETWLKKFIEVLEK